MNLSRKINGGVEDAKDLVNEALVSELSAQRRHKVTLAINQNNAIDFLSRLRQTTKWFF